jgi:Sigma-70, region 4
MEMLPQPPASPPASGDGPKGQGHALQLPAVPQASLDEFAGTEAARRLALLEADRELVHRLMWRQYQGPEWRRFAAALAEYGVQVVRAWVHSGLIFVRCKQKRVGTLKSVPRSSDDSTELAGETVSEALHAFRAKVLIPAIWDPTRGATLKTYFIGQCLFQFPNVYRRWVREDQHINMNDGAFAQELAARCTPPAPAHVLIELSRLLHGATCDSPEILEALVEMGHSQAEIAELVGTTLRAVESRLYRYRKRVAT